MRDTPTAPPEISPEPTYCFPQCHARHSPRIGEAVTRRLVEKSVGVEADGHELVLQLPDGERRLSHWAATVLRDELTAALAGREEYVRTAGEHRPDGSYVVSRLQADSTGHAKRFRDFRALESFYERLPQQFDAEAVGDAVSSEDGGEQSALSGSRRHLVLRHLAEHPAFDCELDTRQPLTAQKTATAAEEPAEPNPTDSEVTPIE